MCDHSFLFHSLFFVRLQNCFPNLRLSHWTLDPGTFQNIFVPCCDNDYAIFKTNHHITSSDSCEVDKQNTFFTRKRNINAFKSSLGPAYFTEESSLVFFSVRGRAGKVSLSQSRSHGFLVWCGRTRHERRAFARSLALRAQKLDLWASQWKG